MSKTIMLSGGMDPIHVGHLRMIKEAADYGDVVVALNSDEWLMSKKGYVFMPLEDRLEIVSAIKGVYQVIPVIDEDDTVCKTIAAYKPDYFGNGGDRKSDNTPEVLLCNSIGVELVWNLGGGKIRSSSELVQAAERKDGF